jgi:hypothetical protein
MGIKLENAVSRRGVPVITPRTPQDGTAIVRVLIPGDRIQAIQSQTHPEPRCLLIHPGLPSLDP